MKKEYLKTVLSILVLLLSTHLKVFTNDTHDAIVNKLPELLGASNAGKEFWLTIPPCYEGETVGDNYIKIYITSETKTVVTVEVAGSGYSEQKSTIPNDVIVFSVSSHTACPWTKNGEKPSPAEKVYPKAGIHIYSEGLLIVYVLFASEFSTESFLALPVSSIGKEYIVSSFSGNISETSYMPCLTGCVAAFDNTNVKFTVGGNSTTKTAGGLKPGDTYTKVLQKGDVIMFAADGDGNDLTGSRWTANKPIAVVSGNFCANIPLGNKWCNYSVEMDFPTETWGMHYHVPKVSGRKYPSIIRVFAKEKNTKLLRNGVPVATLTESGGLQGKGWLEMRLVPIQQLPASAVISADKPISVTLFNTGTQEDGYPMPNSDPFALSITPVEQYQKEITFNLPQSSGDINFMENYINLVYMTDKNGIVPDDLEIAQAQSGEFNWEKIKTKYSSSDEIFAVDVDGKKYAVKKIDLAGGGIYKIRAANKFATYMYGLSYTDIYSHPAAAGLKNLSMNDTIAPIPSYYYCGSCGETHFAKTRDLPENDKNRSNLGIFLFHKDSSYNFIFEYEDFIPGQEQEVEWTLKVINKEKNGRAVITFADKAGNNTTIVEYYDVYKINAGPNIINYGILELETVVTKEFTIKNENTERDVNINRLSFNLHYS